MVIIDNKVANKPHIYFDREKGGWRLQPTYGFNGDHHVDMEFNMEAYLFVCILHTKERCAVINTEKVNNYKYVTPGG